MERLHGAWSSRWHRTCSSICAISAVTSGELDTFTGTSVNTSRQVIAFSYSSFAVNCTLAWRFSLPMHYVLRVVHAFTTPGRARSVQTYSVTCNVARGGRQWLYC